MEEGQPAVAQQTVHHHQLTPSLLAIEREMSKMRAKISQLQETIVSLKTELKNAKAAAKSGGRVRKINKAPLPPSA